MSRGQPARNAPRAFCGACFPWPLINELAVGAEVVACYLLLEKRPAVKKDGSPFLTLVLADRTGAIDAKLWDGVDVLGPLCEPDAVLGVRGRVGEYQGKLQLTVSALERLEPEEGDWERLLPASPRERAQMHKELDALIASVEDAPLRALLRRCLGRGTELGRRFREHPAAKRNHHAYLYGLLEHTVSVASMCDRLAEHYAASGVSLDRDLLVTGALLHDLGKLDELKERPGAGYTTAGHLLGHIVLGIQRVSAEAEHVAGLSAERLLLLLHLIASHQGKPEWDSPKVPQILEALILHYADDLDAKLNQAGALLAGVRAGEWSAYDRALARSFFRAPELPRGAELEQVEPREVAALFMDLFPG